jgi:hypothetical protein
MQSDDQPRPLIISAAEEYMQLLMQTLLSEDCLKRQEILRKLAAGGRAIAVIRRAIEPPSFAARPSLH